VFIDPIALFPIIELIVFIISIVLVYKAKLLWKAAENIAMKSENVTPENRG